MLDRLKTRLVKDARDWWKWSSVWFAVAGGAVTSWVATDPAGLVKLLLALPAWARPLVGVALAATAIGLRLTQRKEAANVR